MDGLLLEVCSRGLLVFFFLEPSQENRLLIDIRTGIFDLYFVLSVELEVLALEVVGDVLLGTVVSCVRVLLGVRCFGRLCSNHSDTLRVISYILLSIGLARWRPHNSSSLIWLDLYSRLICFICLLDHSYLLLANWR